MENCIMGTFREFTPVIMCDTARTKLEKKFKNSMFKAFLADTLPHLSAWVKYTFDCNPICPSVCLPVSSLSFNPSIYLLASFLIYHKLVIVDKISPLPWVLLEQIEMVVIFFKYHMERTGCYCMSHDFALIWELYTCHTFCHEGTAST